MLGRDTFRIEFHPGLIYDGDYPMIIRWSTVAIDTSFDGDVVISYPLGEIVNMKLADSLVVTDPAITSATIITHNPRMPIVSVEEHPADLPKEFALLQNYPNPFNPSTVIRYQIPQVGVRHVVPVRLVVYNLLGQVVATLVNEAQDPGYKSVLWNAGHVPSGVYFCRLTAGDYRATEKVVFQK